MHPLLAYQSLVCSACLVSLCWFFASLLSLLVFMFLFTLSLLFYLCELVVWSPVRWIFTLYLFLVSLSSFFSCSIIFLFAPTSINLWESSLQVFDHLVVDILPPFFLVDEALSLMTERICAAGAGIFVASIAKRWEERIAYGNAEALSLKGVTGCPIWSLERNGESSPRDVTGSLELLAYFLASRAAWSCLAILVAWLITWSLMCALSYLLAPVEPNLWLWWMKIAYPLEAF